MTLVDQFYADTTEAYQSLYALAQSVIAPRLPNRLRSETDDIAQETLVTIFTKKPSFGSELELKAYTIKVAYSKTIDFCRHQKAKKRGSGQVLSLGEAYNHDIAWSEVCPLEEALYQLSIKELHTIFTTLATNVKEGYRVILYDYYFSGLKHDEIALKRKLPIGSVGTYLQRGISLMRKSLLNTNGLHEELLAHLEAPSNARLILPLMLVLKDSEPEIKYSDRYMGEAEVELGVRYQTEAEAALLGLRYQTDKSLPRGIRTPIHNSSPDQVAEDVLTNLRITPKDVPQTIPLSKTKCEELNKRIKENVQDVRKHRVQCPPLNLFQKINVYLFGS